MTCRILLLAAPCPDAKLRIDRLAHQAAPQSRTAVLFLLEGQESMSMFMELQIQYVGSEDCAAETLTLA